MNDPQLQGTTSNWSFSTDATRWRCRPLETAENLWTANQHDNNTVQVGSSHTLARRYVDRTTLNYKLRSSIGLSRRMQYCTIMNGFFSSIVAVFKVCKTRALVTNIHKIPAFLLFALHLTAKILKAEKHFFN